MKISRGDTLKNWDAEDQTAANKNCPNVLWIGRMSFTGGYASITKNYLRAFSKVGINYASVDSLSLKFMGAANTYFWKWNNTRKIFSSSEDLLVVVNEVPTEFDKIKIRGRTRLIGCTLFETHSIPVDWLNYIDLVDEIWVPTQFNRETFYRAGVPKEKLRVVPYCLDTDFFDNKIPPLNIPNVKNFVFLYVLSNLNRKDVGLLLRAYYNAFKKNKDITLLIKIISKSPNVLKQIKESVRPEFDFNDPGLPQVIVMQDNLSVERMRRLYQACDAYVTTERAKGWDFPAMEAMAMGKPVISVDWSGSTEFLNGENSFLIPHRGRLIQAAPELVAHLPLYTGQLWPDVWEEDVIKTLVKAYERKDLREEYGAKGRMEVKANYSLEAVGQKIAELLHVYDDHSYRDTGTASVKILPFKHVCNNSPENTSLIRKIAQMVKRKLQH